MARLLRLLFSLAFLCQSVYGQQWFEVEDRVQNVGTGVNLREEPSPTAGPAGTGKVAQYDFGTVLEKPTNAGGFDWYKIQWDGQSVAGYTANGGWLQIISPGPFTLTGASAWNSASPAGPAVSLSWTESVRADFYEVYKDGKFVANTGIGRTFFEKGGLASGETHTYSVAARRSGDPKSIKESNALSLSVAYPGAPKPNLQPVRPEGWSQQIVVSTAPGNNLSVMEATTVDNLFVDYAFQNQQSTLPAGPFQVTIEVDGVVKSTRRFEPQASFQVLDAAIGRLSAGSHDLMVRLDSLNEIDELSEDDNIFKTPIRITDSSGVLLSLDSPPRNSSWAMGSEIPVRWTLGGATAAVTGFRVSFLMNNRVMDSRELPKTFNSLNWTVPSWFVAPSGTIRLEALGTTAIVELPVKTTIPAQESLYAVITLPDAANTQELPLNRPVTFSAAGSYGNIARYVWEFSGDKKVYSGNFQTISHTFSTTLNNGEGWAKLTVLSASGAESGASISFSLSGAGLGKNQAKTPDPINTATGAFLLGLDLMPVHGRRLPFLFQAYYNSQTYQPSAENQPVSAPGSLGYGWSHSFETSITSGTEDGIATAMIGFGDGHSEKYLFDPGTSKWKAPPGVYSQLEKDSEGKFSLLTHSQLLHHFNVGNRLASIEDRNGNTLRIIWEKKPEASDPEEMRIQRIILPGGPENSSVRREVKFHYRHQGPSFLWKLEDPEGNFIIFNQDGNGDLVSFENELAHSTKYTYDSLHQLETGTDAKGQRFVHNFYNADRRVDRQEDATGNVTLLQYGILETASPASRVTRVTRLVDPAFAPEDLRNEVTEDVYDVNLRLVERRLLNVENLSGSGTLVTLTEQWSYVTTTGQVLSYKNRRGFETHFEWLDGNLKNQKAMDGGTTFYVYGDANNPTLPTQITYPDARVIRKVEYDDRGNLTSSTFPYDPANPDSNKRTQKPDEFGQIVSTTDANGVTQKFDYDEWGLNWRRYDGEQKEYRAEFYRNGRVRVSTDPRGSKVTYLRNAAGAVAQTLQDDPDDPDHPITTQTDYDENGLAVKTIDPLGHVLQTHRDEQGRVWQEEDHEHRRTAHRFDAFGRTIETENAKGGISRRAYNIAGHLLRVASPSPSTNVITYRRDENGNATEIVDGDRVKSTFEYDAMDRQIASRRWKSPNDTEAEREIVRTSYNLLGQKEWDQDEEARKTKYFYDLAGNHIKTVPPEGPEFTFGYDNEGHQTSATHNGDRKREDKFNGRYQLRERIDENGHSETFQYDDAGNLERHVNADSQETGFVHDSLNRLRRINPPTGPPVEFSYNKAGQRLQMSDATGITKWTYTTLRQVETITAPNRLQLAFHYDELGATDRIVYPGNRAVKYRYDTAGRLDFVTDWLDRSITQTYTAGDRLLSRSHPNGVLSELGRDFEGRVDSLTHRKPAQSPLASLTYKFNRLGELSELPDIPVDPNEPDYPRTYGKANELLTIAGNPVIHDNRGNITQAKLNPATATADSLAWDYANRLTGGTIGGVQFTNTFDGLGNRVATARNGQSIGFLVDDRPAMPRIMAELDAAGNPVSFCIYAGNSLLARVLTDGTALYYHGDRQGNVVLVTDGGGASAAFYQYDPFGVTLSFSGTVAASNSFRYLGGLGVYDNGDGTLHARARTYHPKLGRFLSRDANYGNIQNTQSLNRYAYALNDPFKFSDPSGFKPVTLNFYTEPQWLTDAIILTEFWQEVSVSSFKALADIDILSIASPSSYRDVAEIRLEGHERFPGEVNSASRHQWASEQVASKYGVSNARIYGIGNELTGLVRFDIFNLSSRIKGDTPWAFQLNDLINNEIGFSKVK